MDFISRVGNTHGDFELLPHTIVYINSSGVNITTKALKLGANMIYTRLFLKGMLKSIAKGQKDDLLAFFSTTGYFKPIIFADNTFSKD